MHHLGWTQSEMEERIPLTEPKLAKGRSRITPDNNSLLTPARYHHTIGLYQLMLGRTADAFDSFTMEARYRKLWFWAMSQPVGEQITLVLPDTGDEVAYAGRAPNDDTSMQKWVEALTVAITVGETNVVQALLQFENFWVQRGNPQDPDSPVTESKLNFEWVKIWRAILAGDPGTVAQIGEAAEIAEASVRAEFWHTHKAAPVFEAMAQLADHNGPGLVAALDHACEMHYAFVTEDPYDLVKPRTASDLKAAVYWPAAALARIAIDRGICQPNPNPYIPDFTPHISAT